MLSAEFLLTSLIVVLVPGTGVLYTIATALGQGRRASLHAAFGCTLGILPHLAATVLGLAALLHTSALAFQLLRYAGAAYLLYIAYATWRDTKAFTVSEMPPSSATRIAGKAFLLNILNPKLTLFFLAFLPQFVRPEQGDPLMQLGILSAVFMLMTFAVFVAYGLLAHAFRRHVLDSAVIRNWLRRGFASAFAALGLHLASNEQ
jgi:threonine/homoserine/homoserine lactone efflux protein